MAATLANPDQRSEAQAPMAWGLLLLRTDTTTHNGCLLLKYWRWLWPVRQLSVAHGLALDTQVLFCDAMQPAAAVNDKKTHLAPEALLLDVMSRGSPSDWAN